MKKLLIPVAILVAIPTAFISAALGANWITTCQQSHLNNDDPVAFPGQPGAAHQHLFTGARTTNAFSTFESLVASETTCEMGSDRTGYWEPKPLNYNLHPNKGALFYYTGSKAASVFPNGLKMKVGDAKATSEATNWGIAQGRIKFKCGPGSNPEYPQPPLACTSGMLVTVVEFPRWWDGLRLDSPDHISHMSYRRDAGHQVELLRVKAYVRHAVPPGLPIDFTLSSGPYYTYHLVFFDGWLKSELQRFIDHCVKTGRNCGTNPS